MLRKTNSQKGFTIIEVVITIAIGAAVMALVLNAVSGARRSQRNNARTADVGTIVAAINNYYGSRNDLPDLASDIDESLVGELAYYTDTDATAVAAIFAINAYKAAKPSINGTFLTWDGIGTAANALGVAADNTPTAGTGTQITEDGGEDIMVIIKQASCSTDFSEVEDGGIREMAIVYRLEGQAEILCREI